VKIVTDAAQLQKFINKPTVQKVITIDADCTLLLMKRLRVTLDKPLAVGTCVLEISKAIMYDFHYNFVKTKYPGNTSRLLYGDTDSLVYLLETHDAYADMYRNREWFDLSEIDITHPLFGRFYDPSNKKVLGKFKDEYSNSVITHFIAPKAKMYGIRSLTCQKFNNRYNIDPYTLELILTPKECKKAKGITRPAVEKHIPLSDYYSVLENSVHTTNALPSGPIQTSVNVKYIRSSHHVLYTEKCSKKALNGLDTKRFCVDIVNTLAFGHKDIVLYQ